MNNLTLNPGALRRKDLPQVYVKSISLPMKESACVGIEQARSLLQTKVEGGDIVYGVNTGFGRLAQKQTKPQLLTKLQPLPCRL